LVGKVALKRSNSEGKIASDAERKVALAGFLIPWYEAKKKSLSFPL
jgi:hypothetical protein